MNIYNDPNPAIEQIKNTKGIDHPKIENLKNEYKEEERYLEDEILEVEEKKETEAHSCLDRIWYSLNCSTRFDRVIMAEPRDLLFFASREEGRRRRLEDLTQLQTNRTRNWEMELRESMSDQFAVVQVGVEVEGVCCAAWTFSYYFPHLLAFFFPKFIPLFPFSNLDSANCNGPLALGSHFLWILHQAHAHYYHLSMNIFRVGCKPPCLNYKFSFLFFLFFFFFIKYISQF